MPARVGGDVRAGGNVRLGVAMMGNRLWDLQDEDEWEFEYEVQRLERRLEKAIEKEDYKRAAKARDKLYRCWALCRGGTLIRCKIGTQSVLYHDSNQWIVGRGSRP